MKNNKIIIPLLAIGVSSAACAKKELPNIVVIVADDIGYGDFGCYGAELISTPNVDKIAQSGVRFENAYAPAATSSPSRYALLTGEYAWRKRVGILSGNAKNTIDSTRMNLPTMLKEMGYQTAVVGKWHLGLGAGEKPINFNEPISRMGVRSVGFDYSFIFPATNDRVPTIYMENDLTVGLEKDDPIAVSYTQKVGDEPTGREFPDRVRLKPVVTHDGTIVNGIGRIGWMSGGQKARWRDEDMSDDMLGKAQHFIAECDSSTPLFMYYATHTAHAPRVSNERFAGKSGAGHYGDMIEEFDYCVGGIVEALEQKGILDNTIIVVTSDNGGAILSGYYDGCLENIGEHDPFRGLRGHKGSLYEGGTKVPFIISWGKGIKRSFVQSQRFCFTDLFATLADILSFDLTPEMAKDGVSAKELILDAKAELYRPYILTQDNDGSIAIRRGDWKYIQHLKSRGGQSELFNLTSDPAETADQIDNPECQEIIEEFKGYVAEIKYNL